MSTVIRILLSVILLLSFDGASFAAAAMAAANPSVQVLVEAADGSLYGTCSGAVVNTNVGPMLLSAGHCVAGTRYGMVDEFGNKTRIEPAYVDHIHDISLFNIGSPAHAIGAYDLACDAHLTPGEHTHMIGYPLDFGRLTVEGKIITAEKAIGPWPVAATADMMGGEGNSGSAVTGDDGRVIGILTGGYGSFGTLTIVVPVSVVCNPDIA